MLSNNIYLQMAIYDAYVGLKNFIQWAIRISEHMSACELNQTTAFPPSTIPPVAPPAPEPMQVDT